MPGRCPHWVEGCPRSATSGDSEESTRKGCRPTSSQAPLCGPGEQTSGSLASDLHRERG